MSYDGIVDPVKGILKALETGIKTVRRMYKSADSAPAEQLLQMYGSVKNLQETLEAGTKAIRDKYNDNLKACGEQFAVVLVKNDSRLKELRVELRDEIDRCPDLDEEPDSFDPRVFKDVQLQTDKCCQECIQIFNGVRDQLLQTNQRSHSLRKPVPPPQPSPILPTTDTSIPEPAKPQNSWDINSPSQFDLGAQSSLASPRRTSSRDISPSTKPDDPTRLIPKAVVDSRLSANEDWLEKRRQSRIAFQTEIRKSVVSISSIEEDRASIVFSDTPAITSPILGSPMVVSPMDGRNSRASLSGYPGLVTRQRSQGQASVGTRSSRTSSILQDQRQIPEQRAHRQDSQDSIFGLRNAAPSSPPLSDARSSGSDSWGAPLATTLKLPGFGNGVEDGLEPVSKVDYDNEKMVVENEQPNPFYPSTPTASMKSVDYHMRHDSSFYRFGGFCEGARAVIRGEPGYKLVKRPSGNYSSILSGRCIKCTYEVGWNDLEKDKTFDKAGIYGNSGIRWRQKFLSKCHVKTSSIDEPLYACMFCIEEHKTTEEHDATVFFSVPQLFAHLAKHTRPVPKVSGVITLYGRQESTVVDFDIHFVSMDPRPSPYSLISISQKVATRPSANAISTHHPKNSRSTSKDPEGNSVLHFASGARILGITFPAKFSGTWGTGYHDGERGSFPSAAITLDLPAKEDVLMNPQSSLIAHARWEFKPKDAKEGGWLRFSKGEKLVCIGYTFQDQWCWSGQNSKGKWGLFPAAFVEGLMDGGRLGSSPGSVRGLGLRGITSFGLGRKGSSSSASAEKGKGIGTGLSKDRLGSFRDASNAGGPPGSSQPGLEVVPTGAYVMR